MTSIYMNRMEAFEGYSNFTSLKDFNNQMEMFLAVHKQAFTKREFILFRRLTKYSAKVYGVSNASICTILTAAKEQDLSGESVSESTFHRMKRKAFKLGILESKETKRRNHSQSSNLWIFKRFTEPVNKDGTPDRNEGGLEMATQQPLEEKEMTSLETIKPIKTNIPLTSTESLSESNIPVQLDYTYVPQEVEQDFINTVRLFFDNAYDIYNLWQLTLTAYQESELTIPLKDLQETVGQAFKTAIFFYKQGKIKKTFKGYFHAVLKDYFNGIFRENLFQHDELYFDWLNP